MIRRIAMLFTFCALGTCTDAQERPPNVIVVLVDDMGWMDLGCQGSQDYRTPNVDRLASEGIRYTNGYAACAVCSPTRAALLTGKYPARLGITDFIAYVGYRRAQAEGADWVRQQRHRTAFQTTSHGLACPFNRNWMDLSEVTIADHLKRYDYATCHIGKWHLGDTPWYPDHQGFDVNVGGCALGQPPTYFDPYDRGKKWFRSIPTLTPRSSGEYLTDREADEAVAFIRAHRERPFFLYLAHYAVHTPIQAKPQELERIPNHDDFRQKNRTYAAMIASVDQALGRIMTTLEEAQLTERTIVVFTSDNGGLGRVTNNRPLRSGKGYPYEGGIRVPWIVRWPGRIPAGAVSHQPIISTDLFPTICAATGTRVDPQLVLDGESFHTTWEDPSTRWERTLNWHFPHFRGNDVGPYSIVRRGSWKLIRHYHNDRRELYNLGRDLAEQRDLSGEMPDRVAELDKVLMTQLNHLGGLIPYRTETGQR